MEEEMIGIIVAVVVLILIIVICLVCCVLCRRQNTEVRGDNTNRGNIKYQKVTTSDTLDLHGESVKSALPHLGAFLKRKKEEYWYGGIKRTFSIITGKGKHSRDGRPVLKPVVRNHLRKNGYKHKVDPQNEGRILVEPDYSDIV